MRRAFTLIEMAVVISIIAIIACMLIPMFRMMQGNVTHHRYTIVKQSGSWYQTDSIVRLPDGVRFVDTDGTVIEVHGTYTVYDYQPQAESGR